MGRRGESVGVFATGSDSAATSTSLRNKLNSLLCLLLGVQNTRNEVYIDSIGGRYSIPARCESIKSSTPISRIYVRYYPNPFEHHSHIPLPPRPKNEDLTTSASTNLSRSESGTARDMTSPYGSRRPQRAWVWERYFTKSESRLL